MSHFVDCVAQISSPEKISWETQKDKSLFHFSSRVGEIFGEHSHLQQKTVTSESARRRAELTPSSHAPSLRHPHF